MNLDGSRVLVTGGTGSLGHAVVRRLLSGEAGSPERITLFSRDEAKQHAMRLTFMHREVATDDIIYRSFEQSLAFRIGDVRDHAALLQAARGADLIIHAAALKQVPSCEYFPVEAVQTNVLGARNIVRVVAENELSVKMVVGISTDKACKPINVMGMTKALMERILIEGNLECPDTLFACVRNGNVIGSRGSVVPLFVDQIARGGPVTVTLEEMTRFVLTMDQAVDTIFAAIRGARRGETFVPMAPSARVVDLAEALIDGREVDVEFTGIRPGEKVHEILVSEEERHRTMERGGYFVIGPILPELQADSGDGLEALRGEYTSATVTLDRRALRDLLGPYLLDRPLKPVSRTARGTPQVRDGTA